MAKEKRVRGSTIRAQKKNEVLEKRVVNLSSLQLTESETCLLQKGVNFCPTPSPPDKEELYKDIDAFARRLKLKEYHTSENLEDISIESSYQLSTLEKINKEVIKDNRPSHEPYLNIYVDKLKKDIEKNMKQDPRPIWKNLSKGERAPLYHLSKNSNIIIKTAYKGGATVIMNVTDYLKEAKRQLQNEEYYEKVENELKSEHEQTINEHIKQLVLDGELDAETGELLKTQNSRTPIFYLLPKIHKRNNPGRPVISSV